MAITICHLITMKRTAGGKVQIARYIIHGDEIDNQLIFSFPKEPEAHKRVYTIADAIDAAIYFLDHGRSSVHIRATHGLYAVATPGIGTENYARVDGGVIMVADSTGDARDAVEELLSEWEVYALANPRESGFADVLNRERGD